ncbi:MAG: galactokinase [Spirochaetes bacterium]|nr:galactokinase [Spirochaetota bacterium]
METIDKLIEAHSGKFGPSGKLRVFACPGRINLIGEHIDYNGGHVLPAAVDKSIYLVITPNDRKSFRFFSTAFGNVNEISINDLYKTSPANNNWWIYPAGVIRTLAEDEWPLEHGYDMSFASTIPVGSGMSSSAALTEVVVFALSTLLKIHLTLPHMAALGQRIETEFAGVSCGIMDQFAVVTGKRNCAVMLNTKNLEYEYVKVDSNVVHWILVNSMVKHSLKDSGYNERRSDCETSVEKLNKCGFNRKYICDFTMEEFEKNKEVLIEREQKRVYHAITEESRTVQFEKLMKRGDYESAGKLLTGSHESLRDNYEVSIPELDKMVEWAMSIEGVLGSRMMGGGFGGCTINMVKKENVSAFKEIISDKFRKEFRKETEIYDCVIGDGVREIIL